MQLSEFLRKIAELGYSKVWETGNRGEFSQRGGVIHIFPINYDEILTIEFEGNYILEIAAAAPSSKPNFKSPKKSDFFPGGAAPFRPGDYVVHIDHGIGIFRCGRDDDYMIEYAAPKIAGKVVEPDTLFVPKVQIKRLSPYLGFKKPEIHRLGTPIWSITKRKAKEDIMAFAKELLKSLAARKTVSRIPYKPHKEPEEEIISNFPHEYTADQVRAIEEVFADMEKPEPMERIVTGDVGFGKTEVALLAAFRTVLNGKQVAVLSPTTILADQHFEVFNERLAGFGVEVARLTRLETIEKIKDIAKKLESGVLDIVIGTHKILGKNFVYKNLGLLIIDEEQKFGVRHKEHFKKLFPQLDVLTLSATPIPRTLNMALSGIRPISTIETAPTGKSEIKTYVLPKNKKIMKEAILAELERNGQIYFLANRIHKIPQLLEEIKTLKTGARIAVLHGRMSEKQLIGTMHDFRTHKFDMLLSTTIIENGLDLSNVNTLIVEDATKLGLSQAHQLRGRIGRGEREGFAYFLYTTQRLKERAAERLEALERYSWLGAGLEIAKRDLELRGAGNILGKAQSGIAYRVGLNLYFELLEEAIAELKGSA
ncbi:MAG: Transcription-repair coupling factor [Parcubacteria group bacterium GW2011_GWA2_44_13]|nr:MAG: Transcription-repair coupling factor [Parcubacteria group bacterium GW2011_GWA2_44_13]